ncbi:uncharacterized protein LOC122254974 [Penaeus japonicus]|uniref:uncharacterized protein LOC122254974 n=1 Tax=Penaeus japonicus TaxID=27405 RepID=UPI001C70D63A|nr:uncharacterized protein LOC122254974 [Penaeus japonicus]
MEEDKIDMAYEALEDKVKAEDLDRVYVKAHLLQRKDIIQILKPKSNLEWEEVIKKVLERYQEREDQVICAARRGRYRSGVDLPLRHLKLPATMRDAEGKTILHHAVYAKDDKGFPKWSLKSLRSLLEDHHCFVNAVDYEGRTCLHILAERAPSVHSLKRDGQIAQDPDVWLKMAKILIEFGCRSVQDYSEHLPHEIAKQNGNVQLSNYLQQEYQKLVVENAEESDSFEELVAAAQENDVKNLEKLLVHVSPLLPLDATQDPLTEAVKRGNLDAALVLMCAGAPLCGLPLDCITPLEAAHGRADLLALLPAILRKEYANKLKDEASRISSRDPQSVDLQENIEGFATEVEEIGPKAVWRFTRDYEEDKEARSKKARELLCAAAGLGLPLSCQMLGLEDVHLHPLPREDTPIRSALKGKKENMLYILFRDLHMSLSAESDSRLPSAFYKEALKSELKKFKQFCIRMKLLAGEEPDSLLHELSGALNGSLKSSISKDMMLCISGYGLVLLLSKFIKHTDINCVIDDISGFTMLHVSALYGRLAMVEYLLFNGADINIESKDGFTAAHVAAMKGQMECVAYLQAFQSRGRTEAEQDTSTIPVSIHELAEGYKALVKEFSPLLLPAKFGLDILSKPQDESRTKLILQRKMEHLNISDNDSFRTYIADWRRKARNGNTIEREMESLLQEMGGKTNSKFKGKLVQRDPKSTVVNDFTNDFLQMFWEVEKKSYGDYQVIHNSEEVCSIEVKYEDQKMNAIAKRFREEFYDEVKTTLATYKFKIPTIWRSYPRIAMEEIGVTIYLVWYDGNITRQVRVLIVPLLRTGYPEDTDGLPALVRDCLQEEVPVYITRTKENGKWIYVMTQLEDMIVSRLTDEQQLVLSACRFLCNVLNPCWWFPRVQSKRHGSIWHSYAISASDVPDHKQIVTLFLEEITQTQEKDWESSKFLERVSGVYKRATYNDNSNNPRTLERLKTFLDPKHSHFIPSSGALAIVDALSSLQMEVPKSRRRHIFVC